MDVPGLAPNDEEAQGLLLAPAQAKEGEEEPKADPGECECTAAEPGMGTGADEDGG